MRRTALYAAITFVFALVVCEVGLRVAGFGPLRDPGWEEIDYHHRVLEEQTVEYSPSGRPARVERYRRQIPDGRDWTVTALHTDLPDPQRVTRPLEEYRHPVPGERIWLFGDSNMEGWGINDDETFAWRLQERRPDYVFVNFGVAAYSTLHSLLAFEEAIESWDPPKAVLLTYASFLDLRDAQLQPERKRSYLLGGPKQGLAYARIRDGELRIYEEDGSGWEFMLSEYSALFHLLEQTYSLYQTRTNDTRAISRAVIDRFADGCEKRGIRFFVVGIWPDPKTRSMLSYTESRGIPSIDISLPMRGKFIVKKDGHPSPLATRFYARRIDRFLQRVLP